MIVVRKSIAVLFLEEAELGYYVGLQRRGFVFDRMWMVVSFGPDGSTSPVRVVKGL